MNTPESLTELVLVVAAAGMFVWAGVNWWLNWRLSRRRRLAEPEPPAPLSGRD